MRSGLKRILSLLLAAMICLGMLAGCSVGQEIIEDVVGSAVDGVMDQIFDETDEQESEQENKKESKPESKKDDKQENSQAAKVSKPDDKLDKDGEYTSKDEVALYLYTYGELPKNFITKKEARELGWQGGGLDDYDYGKSIGGDHFGNHEGLLPEASGRKYFECDIDTMHAEKRGAKRIIYSNDGLIYYTGDHYESYTLLYGEE